MKKKYFVMFFFRFRGFESFKLELEQYRIFGDVVVEFLWLVYFFGEVEGKVIVDLGVGIGVLGIGVVLLGVENVYVVERDKEVFEIVCENVCLFGVEDKIEFVNVDVLEFLVNVDIVIMNFFFGSQVKYVDRFFFIKVFEVSDVVYLIYFVKFEVRVFIEVFVRDNGFVIIY